MNEGAGRGASAMAGELPQIGVRPPPLLFQFPSLSPSSSFWSVQQQQQQQPQQHSHPQHLAPASIFLTEQQLQMFHQQPQSHSFYQLQRPSPAAPDLNRPPLQAYLPPPFHGQQRQQQQQQMVASAVHGQANQQQKAAVFRPPMVVPLVNRRPEATIMQRPSGYPVAASAHEEVVSDAGLFFQTLVQLSSDLGRELVVPRVGGKEFELHRLYCEVTELGGLEKVTREKRWKDIATGFDLPETVTNPVYFLRKHYINLLHHYEQVYYHRNQGPLVPPPDALPKPVPVEEKPKDVVSKKRGRSKSSSEASVGHVVTGAIEGKFEHGYFVTVVVGSEKLRGVIYNVPRDQKDDDAGKPAAEAPSPVKLPTKKSPRQKKRKRRARKDPDGIKSPRNPYNFFVAEQRQGLKGAREEMSRKIGGLWSGLSQEEKLPYAEMARKDKERYEKEKLEFAESRPAGNDAVAAAGCVNPVEQPESEEMNPSSEPQQ